MLQSLSFLLLIALGGVLAQEPWAEPIPYTLDSTDPTEGTNPTDPTGTGVTDGTSSGIMDCVLGCLGQLQSSEMSTQAEICSSYINYESCVQECPNGDEIWRMALSMLPSTFQQLDEFCENPENAEFTMRNSSNPALSCTADCRQFLNFGLPSIELLCDSWGQYSACVLRCPDGERVMAEAREMVPDSFAIIDKYCHGMDEPLAIDHVAPVSAQTGSGSGSDLKPWARSGSVEESSGDSQLKCVDTCLNQLMVALNVKTQEAICGAYDDYEDCVRACPDGDNLWEAATAQMSQTVSYIEDFCNDPKYADVEDLSSTAPPGTDIACVHECKDSLVFGSGSIDVICSSYESFRGCITRCPDGERIMAMADEMFPDMVRYINSSCNMKVEKPTDDVKFSLDSGSAEEEFPLDFGPQVGSYPPSLTGDSEEMLECVKGCVSELLDDTDFTDREEVCTSFAGYQPCVEACPNGEQIYSMAESMFPDAFQNLEEICSGDLSEPITPAPEQREFANCVSERRCTQKLTQGVTGDIDTICQGWTDFQSCVMDCPGGLDAMRRAETAMPQSMRTFGAVCGSPSTGAGLLNSTLFPLVRIDGEDSKEKLPLPLRVSAAGAARGIAGSWVQLAMLLAALLARLFT